MTDKKIVIIDYGVGNILSIKNAITFHGYRPVITNKHSEIENATHIILPGVGAYPSAMNKLKDLNLLKPINKARDNQAYILGICLGMQVLFESSEEFETTKGLGLVKGKIIMLNKFKQGLNFKLPNIGWRNCDVDFKNDKIDILKDILSTDEFYFVHSYALVDYEKNLNVLKSKYQSIEFPAIIKHDNIYGCQFHPEKSGSQGLRIIKNFLQL